MPKPPDAERLERAKQAFEGGMTLRDTGKLLGVSQETIRRWATSHGWKAPEIVMGKDRLPKPVPTTEEIEAARMRAEKAAQEARTRWATRRASEADAAGITAGAIRQKLLLTIEAENRTKGCTLEQANAGRALALAYANFVDRAQVLSGEMPVRGRSADDEPRGPRPTDPRAMVAAGRERALRLMPSVEASSTEVR